MRDPSKHSALPPSASLPVMPSVPNMPPAEFPFTFLSRMSPIPLLLPSYTSHLSIPHLTVAQSLPTHTTNISGCSSLSSVPPQLHSTCLMMYSMVREDFLALDLHMGRSCHGAKIQKKPRGTQTNTVCWKHTGRSASGRAR